MFTFNVLNTATSQLLLDLNINSGIVLQLLVSNISTEIWVPMTKNCY